MITGMEKINDAILSKVREEAQGIIAEAEDKARQELEKARKQHEARIENEKRKLIAESKTEAARILAQSSIKARQEVLRAKSDIVEEIIHRVRESLSQSAGSKKMLKALLAECIMVLGTDEVRVSVASKDRNTLDKLISEDKDSGLAGKIRDIKEADILGGVIVEDLAGKIRIDNSYETRLEMLLPQIMPQVNKVLFAGVE